MALRGLRVNAAVERLARSFLQAAGYEAALHLPYGEEETETRTEGPAATGTLVTRATMESLKEQLGRMRVELQVEIPEAIRRAREHGDLSENAEYDAAKERQAQTRRRYDELEARLKEARLIDEMHWEEGSVIPGTWVVLQEEGRDGPEARRSIWVLGDGEDGLADEAVSHRSPVGQALIGRRIGERAMLRRAGEEIPYRILSVERRLP
jgi:transcription elongation factor GreA